MNFDDLFEGDTFDELDALIEGMETPEAALQPQNEDIKLEE